MISLQKTFQCGVDEGFKSVASPTSLYVFGPAVNERRRPIPFGNSSQRVA